MKFMENGLIDFRDEPEGVDFSFSQNGGAIRIISSCWCPQAVDIAEEPYLLGVVEIDGIIIVVVRFGCDVWFEVPYHVSMSKPYELGEVNCGYPISVYFVDKSANDIAFMRPIKMPLDISKQFKKLVEKQQKDKLDVNAVLARIDEIHKKYTLDDLMDMAGLSCKPPCGGWLREA